MRYTSRALVLHTQSQQSSKFTVVGAPRRRSHVSCRSSRFEARIFAYAKVEIGSGVVAAAGVVPRPLPSLSFGSRTCTPPPTHSVCRTKTDSSLDPLHHPAPHSLYLLPACPRIDASEDLARSPWYGGCLPRPDSCCRHSLSTCCHDDAFVAPS